MTTDNINGKEFYNLLLAGYTNLQKNKTVVDELNVFPIPDGDTGKNMVGTLYGGIEGAKNAQTLFDVASAFSKHCLFSARGNSGVILSQFIKGICNYVTENSLEYLNAKDFAYSLRNGYKQAYKAVIKAVEGTMLTVMRESAEALIQSEHDITSFERLFEKLVFYTEKSLKNTPNLLSVLKEANVVDSGGAGVLFIFEGMQKSLTGFSSDALSTEKEGNDSAPSFCGSLLNGDMKFGYCTEFILQLTPDKTSFNEKEFSDYLNSVGDSVVIVCDEEIVKAHVHTFEPEKAFAYAHRYGEFLNVKVENMDLQNLAITATAKENKPKKHLKYAVVAVASGEGIARYFTEIGINYVIDGGQTQNPSSQDFIKAFETLDAENIIVLPNNANVILSAKQAKEIYSASNVFVIETKSIAQGYSAISMMDLSSKTVEEFISSMNSNLENVTTGYVAKSNRNAQINSVTVNAGDYIAIEDGVITCSGSDKNNVALEMLARIKNIGDKQTIIVFVGLGVTDEEKESLEENLNDIYPLYDIAFIEGGQPIYEYVLSIE